MAYKDAKVNIHICVKCIRTKKNTCPFVGLRHKIVNCSSYEHKDAAHDQRRWAKYEHNL